MSRKALEPQKVRKAMQEEMGELAKHGVYEKMPVKESWTNTGKAPIGTRWVDVTGDEKNPYYRLRLVAPPLEAKKLLFSLAVAEGIGFQHGCKGNGHPIGFIDVRRAYFLAQGGSFMLTSHQRIGNQACADVVVKLGRTRDAAQNREHAYVDFLLEQGFPS